MQWRSKSPSELNRQLFVLTSRSLFVFSIYFNEYSCNMRNNTGDKSWENEFKKVVLNFYC